MVTTNQSEMQWVRYTVRSLVIISQSQSEIKKPNVSCIPLCWNRCASILHVHFVVVHPRFLILYHHSIVVTILTDISPRLVGIIQHYNSVSFQFSLASYRHNGVGEQQKVNNDASCIFGHCILVDMLFKNRKQYFSDVCLGNCFQLHFD